MENCFYVILAYSVGLFLFVLFRKQKDKQQFIRAFLLQTVKEIVWIVPLSTITFGIGNWFYELRAGNHVMMLWGNIVSTFTVGAILGALIGLAVSFGDAGRKLGMKW